MNMREIDRLRAELDARRADVRKIRGKWAPYDPDCSSASGFDDAEYKVAAAEQNVEAALREWWAQGCAPECSGGANEAPATYHDHERDGGSLLSLLAYVDELEEGWGRLGEALIGKWALIENMKSARDAIRKHLPSPTPEIPKT